MYHPDVLAQVLYRRGQCRATLVDACTDTAEFFGISWQQVGDLLTFVHAMGIR